MRTAPARNAPCKARIALAAAALLAQACFDTTSVLESDAGSHASPGRSAGGGGTSASGGGGAAAKIALDPAGVQALCTRGGLCQGVSTENIDKVDLLFVIDDTETMAPHQQALRPQLPRLTQELVTGDADGDGVNDFPPARDLHFGVVTSDMGVPGVVGVDRCRDLGADGLLQHTPTGRLDGLPCQPSYAPFLSFMTGVNSPLQTAGDLSCIGSVGTSGCGFAQLLESPMKALWPKEDGRLVFLDPEGRPTLPGHGGQGENAGFLRNDPVTGLSVIAVIVFTDKDDCSSSDPHVFTPSQYLGPNDPLSTQGMKTRCHFNPPALYPVERYINGLRTLRPDRPELVVFAAIAGVPEDVALAGDFMDSVERDAFYAQLFVDPRMQEKVDDRGTPDVDDDRVAFVCQGRRGGAAPALRLARVAQGFGANGTVQSICADDLGYAMDDIVARIAPRLGQSCLTKPVKRNPQGLTACRLLWELPRPGTAPALTPTSCGGPFSFLMSPQEGQTTSVRGGQLCEVVQLAEVDDGAGGLAPALTMTRGQTFTEGWYYDDFSDDAKKSCVGGKQRISFTPAAEPPPGVRVILDCAK